MSARAASLTLTVPRESFAFTGTAARSTEPEVFTFERVPVPVTAVRSCAPLRPRKRATRVMYPPKVHMHLPPPERSRAKRWLLVLCLVVLWQVYTEEPCAEPCADAAAADYQLSPFPSAEVPAFELPARCGDPSPPGEPLMPDSECLPPAHQPDSRGFEQSAGKSYMVALLVYHRLGNDN